MNWLVVGGLAALMVAATGFWSACNAEGQSAQAGPTTGPSGGAGANRPDLTVSVDPRAELMSVIFRLAKNPEYLRGMVESYTKAADQHFGPFRDHAVVRMAQGLRQRQGVSWNAPMSLAMHLTDLPALEPAVPMEPWPAGLDFRWKGRDFEAFLRQARLFAREAKFDEFFAAHRDLYDAAVERAKATIAAHARLEWFGSFFGAQGKSSFHVVLGMLNGPYCYGSTVRRDGAESLYCVLGVWETDAGGKPQFSRSVMPTVIHEFAHAYVNPLVDRHAKGLEPPGMKLYARVEQAMLAQAYGDWWHLMTESLTRASVVRHRAANEGGLAAATEIVEQQKKSFAWTGDLSRLLAAYEQQRDKYPTFEAFMPQVEKFFEDYASAVPPATTQEGQ